MEWIETNVYTTSEGVEAVCAVLMDNGINGIQIEDAQDMQKFIETNPMNWDYVDESILENRDSPVYVKFYLSNTPQSFEVLNGIKKAINQLKSTDVGLDLGSLAIENANVDDEDWKNNWKKYYKPIEIGKRVAVKPEWEEYENKEGRIVFNINPGHVFGTGLHQTTQLCIEQLENYIDENSEVLDLGCGTGILSIISLMLGAGSAAAIDIEYDAIKIAYDNAQKNGIDQSKYTVLSGNVLSDTAAREKLSKKKYNVVIANIVADIIIGLTPYVHENITDDGVFICSGIIDTRVGDVHNAFREHGFEVLDTISKDDWYCIVSKKFNTLQGKERSYA